MKGSNLNITYTILSCKALKSVKYQPLSLSYKILWNLQSNIKSEQKNIEIILAALKVEKYSRKVNNNGNLKWYLKCKIEINKECKC